MKEPLSVVSHTQALLEQLNSQRNNGEYCDIEIKVQDTSFKLHRCLMAASSPVLHNMLKKMDEDTNAQVNLQDELNFGGVSSMHQLELNSISLAGFQGVIEYIYGGQVELMESNIHAIHEAAKYLEMRIIEVACVIYAGASNDGDVPIKSEGNTPEETSNVRKRLRPKSKHNLKSKPRKLKRKNLEEVDIKEDDFPDLEGEEEEEEGEGVIPEEEEESDEETKVKTRKRKRRLNLKMKMKAASMTAKQTHIKAARTAKPKERTSKRRSCDGERVCDKCGVTFPDKRKYLRHMKMHEREDGFPCSICDLKFGQKSALGIHIRSVHLKETYYCQYCSFKTREYKLYTSHVWQEHQDGKPFYCNKPGCSYKAQKLHKLKEHLLTHDGVRKYPCTTCGKLFAQEKHVRLHLRTCLKLRTYLCDLCGAEFSLQQSMKNHRRLHTMEKPFKCDYCGKTFADRANCRRHKRIHEKSYPYHCEYCQQQFRHSNSLKSHLKTGHGIEVAKGVCVQAKKPDKPRGAPMFAPSIEHPVEHRTDFTKTPPEIDPKQLVDFLPYETNQEKMSLILPTDNQERVNTYTNQKTLQDAMNRGDTNQPTLPPFDGRLQERSLILPEHSREPLQHNTSTMATMNNPVSQQQLVVADERNRQQTARMPAAPMGAFDERLRTGAMFPNYDERLFNSALLLNLSQYMGNQ